MRHTKSFNQNDGKISLRMSQEYQQQYPPPLPPQQITVNNNQGNGNLYKNNDINHNYHYANDYSHQSDPYYQNDNMNGKKYKINLQQDINQQVNPTNQPNANSHVDLSKSNYNPNNVYYSNDIKSLSNKNQPLSHTDEYLINNFRPFSNNNNNSNNNSNTNNNTNNNINSNQTFQSQQPTISSSSSTSNKSRYSTTTLTQPTYIQPQSQTNNSRSSQINIPNPSNSVGSPTRHSSIINNNPKIGHLSHDLINSNNSNTYHNYNNHSNHHNYHKQSLMDLTSNSISSYTAPRNRKIQSILLNDEKSYSKSPNLGYSSSFSKSIVNLNGNSHLYSNTNLEDETDAYYSTKRVDLSGEL